MAISLNCSSTSNIPNEFEEKSPSPHTSSPKLFVDEFMLNSFSSSSSLGESVKYVMHEPVDLVTGRESSVFFLERVASVYTSI